MAVNATLTAVTKPVPNLRVTRSAAILDMMVQPDIIIVMIPIQESATPNSACIIGHAEPRSESGKPKLINAK